MMWSRTMNSNYAKLVRMALVFGGACFLMQWGLAAFGWSFFPDRFLMRWVLGFQDWSLIPDKPFAYEIMRQIRWLGQVVTEKIVGLVLLSITAFFASRAYRPTWKWGLATGIAAAVSYQVIAVFVYFLRFGMAAYGEYDNFL